MDSFSEVVFMHKELERLEDQIKRFTSTLERMQLEEYLRYIENTPRLIRVNFISGLARGVGNAVGFTILGAILVVILKNIVVDNIPLIGEFLAEVLKIVNARL